MFLPKLKASVRAEPIIVNNFKGFNDGLSIDDNQFSDMKNVSSRCYPFVASSGKRKVIKKLSGDDEFRLIHAPMYPDGDISENDFCGVIGNRYYYNNKKVLDITDKLTLIEPFDDVNKYPYLADVSVNVCEVFYNNTVNFFPTAKCYDPIRKKVESLIVSDELHEPSFKITSSYNMKTDKCINSIQTVDSDNDHFGLVSDKDSFKVGESVRISYNLSDAKDGQGNVFNFLTYDSSDPAMREAIFAHPDKDELIVECVISKIDTKVIDNGYYEENVITKLYFDCYNIEGELICFDLGRDSGNNIRDSVVLDFDIEITKAFPTFSFLCESGGRIFGLDNHGKTIRACKLYDPKTWFEFDGGADASWFAEVSSTGEWTGMISFGGYVYCFKKDICYVVFGDNSTNFTIAKTINVGCIDGRSLKIVGNSFIFLSADGFCQMTSSQPVFIYNNFSHDFKSCVAGSVGNFYYASVHYDDDICELWVYDGANNIWCKEDDFDAVCFFNHNNKLYGCSKKEMICFSDGEFPDEWFITSKRFNDNTSQLRCLCEMFFRLKIPAGADVTFFVSYDGGEFVQCGSVIHSKYVPDGEGSIYKINDTAKGLHIPDEVYSQRVPVRLRACSTYQFKMVCHGNVILESYERVLSVSGQLQT